MSDNQVDTCYFYRVITLVIDIGTGVLLKTFYSKIPQAQVKTIFISKREDFDGLRFRKRPVLTQPQYDLVTSPDPKPEEYDITLLIILLRNVCPDVEAPKDPKGWDVGTPDAADGTLGAELLRFKAIRNKVTAHTSKAQIDEPRFVASWREIKDILIRIARMISVKYEDSVEKDIIDLKDRVLDPMGEEQKKILDAFINWQATQTEELNICVQTVQTCLPYLPIVEGKTHTTDGVIAVHPTTSHVEIFHRLLTDISGSLGFLPSHNLLTRVSTVVQEYGDAYEQLKTQMTSMVTYIKTLNSNTAEMKEERNKKVMYQILNKLKQSSPDTQDNIPDIRLKLTVENCEKDIEKYICQNVMAYMDEQCCDFPEHVKQALNELVKKFIERDMHIDSTEYKCIMITLGCHSVHGLSALYTQYIEGTLNAIFEPLQTSLRLLGEYENVRIEAHIWENEILQSIFDIVGNLLTDTEVATDQGQSNVVESSLITESEVRKRNLLESTESDDEEAEAIWPKALRKCYTKLVCDMEPMSILDRFQEMEFLPKASLSDIQEFQLTTEKNRAVVDKVLAMDEQGYNVFKKCLQNTEQNHLADHLTAVEKEIKVHSLPAEILRMDKQSIELYQQILKEGKEAVHTIRIMVVGQFDVGKTALTRRLLGKHVDINTRESTNGIEVHNRRCKVSLGNGKWNVLKQDDKSENTFERLAKLMAQQELNKHSRNKLKRIMPEDSIEHESNIDGIPINTYDVTQKKDYTPTPDEDTEQDNSTSIDPPVTTESDTDHHDTETNIPINDDTIIEHIKGVIQEANNPTVSDYADLSIWDFAGHDAFYATHQVFLSWRAIYLLVTDISKPLQDVVVEDKCYLDSTGSTSCSVSEFWLNSIHEYCSSQEPGIPPVILVGTHADKLDQEKKEELTDKYFNDLRKVLKDKDCRSHLVDADFMINNAIEDPNLTQLKDKIFEVASKQQYWGELIPARWITLEKAIIELRCEGIKICKRKTLLKINKALPVPLSSDEEVELFLRFHHDSGNILYLSSHEDTSDNILLDPQWLIDAFKCLITAAMFSKKKPEYKQWLEFDKTGKLKQELIDAVWKETEFYDHQDHLITLLEQLDIIARPRSFVTGEMTDEIQTKTEDYFFAPCVLKHSPPKEIFQTYTSTTAISTSRLCFSMTNKAIPVAMFNRLLAACLTKWPVSKQGAKDLIFCGCGVFDVDRQHRLTLFFSQNVIQIWITKFAKMKPQPNEEVCMQVRTFIEGTLTKILKQMSATCDFKTSFKCPISTNVRSKVGMFDLEDILNADEVTCDCDDQTHVLTSADMLKYWNFEKECCEDHISEDIYKKVLRKCYTRLLSDMEPRSIIDQFHEIEFLPYSTLRDIQEISTTSEKNRAIVDKVLTKGIRGYKDFKKCLNKTKQAHLADRLTEVENQQKQGAQTKQTPKQSQPMQQPRLQPTQQLRDKTTQQARPQVKQHPNIHPTEQQMHLPELQQPKVFSEDKLSTIQSEGRSSELKKIFNDALCQSAHDNLNTQMRSVGALIGPNNIGTGFVVGGKYVMTAWHVVRDIIQDRYGVVDNSKLDQVFINFNEDPIQKCVHPYFAKRDIPFMDMDLDVAVLEIKDPSNLPNSVLLYKDDTCTNLADISLCGFGHLGSNKKHIEHGCQIIKPNSTKVTRAITNLQAKRNELNTMSSYYKAAITETGKNASLVDLGYSGFDDESKLLFSCFMENGASGSPVLTAQLAPGTVYAVGVLISDIPKFHFDLPKMLQGQFPDEYRFEMGAKMSHVYRSMCQKNPTLAQELF